MNDQLINVTFDQRPRLFMTLRCPYNCPTCSVRVEDEQFVKEANVDQWIETLRKLNALFVHVSGGEPSSYKDLHKVINATNTRCKIFTNLNDINEFSLIKREHNIVRATFYPNFTNWNVFYNKLLTLSGNSLLSLFVYLPTWLLSAQEQIDYSKALTDAKIDFVLDVNCYEEHAVEWKAVKNTKVCDVLCIHPWTVIGPDCKRYPCVSKMRRGIDGVEDFTLHKSQTVCNEYGACSCCDTELIRVFPQ